MNVFKAAECGDLKELKRLIKGGVDINSYNKDGVYLCPIHVAASFGKTKFVKALLAAGANIEAKSHVGYTALHYAVSNGHEGCASYLISLGANVNAQDYMGWTPLRSALGYKSCIKILLAAGANINIEDNEGITPLQAAIQCNARGCIKLLKQAQCELCKSKN